MLLHTKYRIPVYLSLLLCAVLCLTMNLYGVAVDEPPYFAAGVIYVTWIEHPIRNTIDGSWSYNHEHPPFGKILGGIGIRIFHDALGTVGLIKAFRLQNLVYCFMLSFIMYLWVSELTDKFVGILTVLMTFFLPRLYFNAHIGTLDYPVTVLMFLSAFAFWKGLVNPRWMVASAILIGFSLLTKINAAFLYAFLGIWMLAAWRKELRSKLRYILSFAAIPPAIFFALWPWLWRHPLARFVGYLAWSKHHWPYYVYYLGKTYLTDTPWHYSFVLTFVTLPLVVLLAVAYYVLCRRKKAVDYFLMLNAAIPIVIVAFSPCKFNGVRLFLPAFPFICMMAGMGVYEYAQKGKVSQFVIAFLVLGAFGVAVMQYRRYQECYYNELVGAARLNSVFETEYEGCPYQEILPWVNAHAEAKFYVSGGPLMSLYSASGQLDPSVAFTNYEFADYVILLSQQGHFDERAWSYFLEKTPVHAIRVAGGIPIVGVYRK